MPRLFFFLALLAGCLGVLLSSGPGLPAAEEKAGTTPVGWQKIVIDKAFRSEGVAVADVNKDGKMDILVGDVWYEGPDFKKVHRIRPGKDDYAEGEKNVYSKSFACWAEDLNGDGWPDLIVIGFPGEPCHWYENPRGKEEMWKQHVICKSACNESPHYADLFGTGKKVLVMGYLEKQMVWVAPGSDPTAPWEIHSISDPDKKSPGSARFDHGLGIGDVNGDGRLDVICTGGWWEQPPASGRDKPWTFHPANLGPACADMYTYDIDGDGKADILSSSAHLYGIWAHIQKPGKDGHPSFLRQDLFPKIFSQTHAMQLIDINGDGLKDFVTGKRRWAHGPKGDADPNATPVLAWFEAKKSRDGQITFTPHQIDDASGIGTQFWTGDFNGDGLPDIVISNKMGVFLFLQARDKK
jgi:hypothetical protein